MKKFVFALASWVLALALVTAAAATPYYLESQGATIEIPDSMVAEDASQDGSHILKVLDPQDASIAYGYILTYVDAFEGKWLEDLTEEEGVALLRQIATGLENPSFGGSTVNGMDVLIAASANNDKLYYTSLLGGWTSTIICMRLDGQMLTEEQVAVAADMLKSLRFDADSEEAANE